MPVIYDDSKKIFHLQSGNASYVMQVVKDKYLAHLYWGKRLSAYHGSRAIIWKDRGFAPNPDDKDRTFSLDTLPQEYPQTGNGDFRNCAYGIRQKNGSRISSLFYKGYEIQEGKPELEGLPASFAKKEEAQTLKIFLEDAVAGLEVCLLYTVWHDRDVITRSVQFKNHSDSEIILTKMLSMSLDIRESEFDVMTLYGAHNNERNIDRRPLTSGTVQIESLRGTSSPHQSPFMALLRKETFGHRDADNSSLGDWFVDRRKLPHGLSELAKEIHKRGMKFGLWFEPEMISTDSGLFRKHPDYVLHTEGRLYTIGRGQLVLDLSRKDVCDYVIKSVSDVLKSTKIDYVKWDMNRHLTDAGSVVFSADQQGEIMHRYVLGLYRIMEEITEEFPDILFESCSSGGGRFDPGMLYYMPQTWCSDNTDAVCRMKIQYATSLMYPAVTMGAHVSVIPNQQTGRVTPLDTRGYVAMSGNLGYEIDLNQLSEEEFQEVKKQIQLYKSIRNIVQQGEFYRIHNPFEENIAAWNFVSKDKKEVLAFWFEILSQPAAPVHILKLKGIDENAFYENLEDGRIYGGDELMYCGISIPLKKRT